MGKRCLALVLALLLALSLSACGSQPGTATPPTGSGGENDSASPTPASHDTTYWTAVRYESYNPSFGRTEVSAMPTEKWWADLYLNEDGTALFREALGFGYASYLINAEWWLGADNALRLTGEDLDGSFISMDGRKEKDGSVMLETLYGNRFYFEPAERPVSGGELCMADLKGTWRMNAGEAEGDEFSPEEMHMASLLNIERWWSDDEGGYTLRADYYSAHLLDTDAPEYETEEDLLTEKLDEPLMYGFPNELWSARLYAEDSEAEYYQLYHANELGMGENRDGIIILLSMDERDYAMFVYGKNAEYAFNKYGQEQLEDAFLGYFGDNDWYGGASHYLDTCDEYLTLAEEGDPVRKNPLPMYLIVVAASCAISGFICIMLKWKMQTVHKKVEANEYVAAGGLTLTKQYDRYTHTTETRRKIRDDSDSGGSTSSCSGGGGSGRSGSF